MDRNETNNSWSAFVITRLGQLRNVHSLIEQESLKHNVLVIMFTPRDTFLLSNLRNACRKELFDDVLYLKLPKFPLRLNRKKSEAIYAGMEEILKELYGGFSINELYLCNIDSYYVYFERIIKERGYSIAINLLEEGLTTYKITSGQSLDKKEDPPNKNDVKKAWNGFKKALRKFIVSSGILVLQCISFVIRKPLVSYAHNLWIRLSVDKTRRFGIISDLNKVYVCFPEMVKDTGAINFASVQKLQIKFNKAEDETAAEEVKGYPAIFVNQKYVNYASHFRIVFQIFDEMGIDKVLIKLHPKEDEQVVRENILKAQAEHENIDVKILSSAGQIPVEDLVYTYGIKKVIALTSSALIYLNTALEGTQVISIAERYRQLCGSDAGVASRELVQFDDEYRFFKRFEDIPQFVPESGPEEAAGRPGQGA